MSNTVVTRIKILGEERATVKELFDKAAVPTKFGCAWDFSGFPPIICDVAHGDEIVVEEDSIIIKGETKDLPPLPLVIELSSKYRVVFEVKGNDPSNCWFQRWIVESGDAFLLDCIQGAYAGEGEDATIVYMRDGKQFVKLPFWVPAVDAPEFRDEHDNVDEQPCELALKPLSAEPLLMAEEDSDFILFLAQQEGEESQIE